MVSTVEPSLMDSDYDYIMFEFNMNYSVDSVRSAYHEAKQKEAERASDDLLRKLGYSDSDILNRKD